MSGSEGRIVIEGGKWIIEKRCSECGELFPKEEADRIKSEILINKIDNRFTIKNRLVGKRRRGED